jgi:hypothetical protein
VSDCDNRRHSKPCDATPRNSPCHCVHFLTFLLAFGYPCVLIGHACVLSPSSICCCGETLVSFPIRRETNQIPIHRILDAMSTLNNDLSSGNGSSPPPSGKSTFVSEYGACICIWCLHTQDDCFVVFVIHVGM